MKRPKKYQLPIFLTLLSKRQNNWEIFSNFVAFSQCLNFMHMSSLILTTNLFKENMIIEEIVCKKPIRTKKIRFFFRKDSNSMCNLINKCFCEDSFDTPKFNCLKLGSLLCIKNMVYKIKATSYYSIYDYNNNKC